MKTRISIIVFSLSVGAFAQEPVVLDSETTLINSHEATLVRTAVTPQKVTVLFKFAMTRNVCTKWRHSGKTRRCIERVRRTTTEADRIQINFKHAPVLGGSEQDIFKLKGTQKKVDSENVIYEMKALETVHPYTIIKKGILGYDSYSVELK